MSELSVSLFLAFSFYVTPPHDALQKVRWNEPRGEEEKDRERERMSGEGEGITLPANVDPSVVVVFKVITFESNNHMNSIFSSFLPTFTCTFRFTHLPETIIKSYIQLKDKTKTSV